MKNYLHFLGFVVLLLLASTAIDGQSCVVAEYRFSGDTLDISGNGNHATPHNVTLTTDRFGNADRAYEFNGIDSYIDLNNPFDLPQRTINIWFNTYSLNNSQPHIYISDNPNLLNGFTQIRVEASGSDTLLSTSAQLAQGAGQIASIIHTNEWHMATITVGADSVRHYLDGVKVGSTPKGSQHSQQGDTSALLGTSRLLDRYFHGKIDDVKIFDCTLTDEEVMNLYQVEDCLIAYYAFNGDTVDNSGNGNTPTLVNVTPTTDRFGRVDSAYEFDGVSSYADFGNSFDLPVRTINVWFNAYTVDNTQRHIFISDNPNLQYGFCQMRVEVVNSDTLISLGAGVLGPSNRSDFVIGTNEWHMATIAYGATDVKHYIDGNHIKTTPTGTSSSQSGGSPTALLGVSRIFDRYFHGKLDDVRIFECALDDQEVMDLYNESPVGIENDKYNNNRSFQVLPNPFSQYATIELSGISGKEIKVKIHSISGQLMNISRFITGDQLVIHRNELPPGVYLISIDVEGQKLGTTRALIMD